MMKVSQIFSEKTHLLVLHKMWYVIRRDSANPNLDPIKSLNLLSAKSPSLTHSHTQPHIYRPHKTHTIISTYHIKHTPSYSPTTQNTHLIFTTHTKHTPSYSPTTQNTLHHVHLPHKTHTLILTYHTKHTMTSLLFQQALNDLLVFKWILSESRS